MSAIEGQVPSPIKANARHPNDAIEKAHALRERIATHRRGAPLPDVSEEIRAMREERDAELRGNLL